MISAVKTRLRLIMECNTKTIERVKDYVDDQVENLENLPKSLSHSKTKIRMEKRLVKLETASQYLIQAQLILQEIFDDSEIKKCKKKR